MVNHEKGAVMKARFISLFATFTILVAGLAPIAEAGRVHG
jgi:hypothetical protein